MSHVYHADLEGYDPEAILHDGCPRCDERGSSGIRGLLQLDGHNLELLWRRCLNDDYSGMNGGDEAGGYRSNAERKLGHELYLIGVLLQNHEDVWQPERFAARRGNHDL